MKKKLIAFDLDGTLAPSKSALPDRMSFLLNDLLNTYQVCVISGGKFEQFEKQLLGNLQANEEKLKKIHIMPTCGTRYHLYRHGKWEKVYSEDFNDDEKVKIIKELKKAVDKFGYHETKTYGEIIEDRGSQISWSAYGQDIVDVLGAEGIKLKEEWDPDNHKKLKLVDYLSPLLEEFEVRAGGTTTIDITKKGIDKAYGMNSLMDHLSLKKEEILFIGDRVIEGGNDYPVKIMGIDTINIDGWQQTAIAIETLIKSV